MKEISKITGPLTGPKGPSISLEQMIALESFSTGFEPTAQRKILSSMSGGHQSRFRGRGMDFNEVRAYQAGDEIKNIDWRVTARTNKVHTKLFTEEKERPVFIVADQSGSLAFGSKTTFKSVTVAYTAALLAWSCNRSGDRVGGIVFSDHEHRELKPKEGKKSILRYLKTLSEFNQNLIKQDRIKQSPQDQTSPSPETNITLNKALSSLHRVIRPGSLIFILSDFTTFDQQTINNLRLLNRHNDLISFFVYDPLEKNPPNKKGTYPVSDGINCGTWNIQSNLQSQSYQEHFFNHHQEIKNALLKQGIPLIDICTEDQPVTILNETFGKRRKNKQRVAM